MNLRFLCSITVFPGHQREEVSIIIDFNDFYNGRAIMLQNSIMDTNFKSPMIQSIYIARFTQKHLIQMMPLRNKKVD